MERLSNIIRTTQQRSSERLPIQRSARERPPSTRRPLVEQSGRAEPITRPQYQPRSPVIPHAAQPQHETRERREAAHAENRPPYNSRYSERPPQGDYYAEEVEPAFPTDWTDDTASMGYGDWEDSSGYHAGYEETNDYPTPLPHHREASQSPRISAQQELNQAAPRPEQLHGRGGPFVTRELQRMTPESSRPLSSRVSREAHLPAPASHLVSPNQGPRMTQRTTQPLRSQQLARLPLEMQQQTQKPQRPMLPEPTRHVGADYTIVLSNVNNLCSVCKGTGFLRSDVPFGHPQFGKAVACECKVQERKRKRRQQLQEISNLGAFAQKRFATFDSRIPGLREAFEESVAFAKNPSGWLLLIGPNGCGKTHLAAAIANDCLEAGSVVLFATVPDLLDHLRAAFAPDAHEVYDQLFARMREAEVLILDDLGVQQSSPWANEKLFQLLNYRYNSGFPTVITANPRGFQTTDERIRSRLSDVGLVVTLNLERVRDYRPNNPRHPSI